MGQNHPKCYEHHMLRVGELALYEQPVNTKRVPDTNALLRSSAEVPLELRQGMLTNKPLPRVTRPDRRGQGDFWLAGKLDF